MHKPSQKRTDSIDPALPPKKAKVHDVTRVAPRILQQLLPEWRTLTIGLLALAIGSGINLLFPFAIGKILNGELGLRLAEDLPTITGILIALFVLQAGSFYVRHYCFTVTGYRFAAELRNTLYNALLRQDVAFFDISRVGDLLSRLSADTQLVQRAVTTNVSVALRYIVQVIGGLVLMILLSAKLTVVILLLIPLVVLSSIYWGRKLRVLSRSLQAQIADATVVAEESLGAIRTVRIFAGERYEGERFSAANLTSLETGAKRARIAAFFSSFMVFLIHSSIAIVIWYGGELVLRSELSLGDLTAFLLYCVIVAVSFGFLANVWDEFMQAVGASERIFEIIDSRSSIVSPKNPIRLPTRTAGSIQFEEVSFSYPSRAEVPVLDKVSFDIRSGETVALVGPSGSGKSTIASLVPRFYDPTAGLIRYCGVALPELDLTELRNDISIVAQDPQVFSLSLFENIAYGRIGATNDEVIAAAKAAHIHSFIDSLPEKYATKVGDRGIQLSGGQRQRVAIARAVLKNPRFLILDEATSALDSENEGLVRAALQELMQGRTTLIIAHRLSTVQHADQVLVIQDGQIRQRGTHQSLVEQTGLYRTLVEHQLL